MFYILTNKIVSRLKVVGYRIRDIDTNKSYNISMQKAMELAANILIINAKYDDGSDELEGASSLNIRRKRVIEISEINKKFDDTQIVDTITESDIKSAIKKYNAKLAVLSAGGRYIFKNLGMNKISLMGVEGEIGSHISIPSFVTDFGYETEYGHSYDYPFEGLDIKSVYVNNRSDRGIRCSKMLGKIDSTSVKVSFAHPETIIDMEEMFRDCPNLQEVEFTGDLNTYNLVSVAKLFYGCEKLERVKFNGLDTSGVLIMDYMFCGCDQLKNLDISELDIDNVVSTRNMFRWCHNLEHIRFNESARPRIYNSEDMFYLCEKLEDYNIGNFKFYEKGSMYQ